MTQDVGAAIRSEREWLGLPPAMLAAQLGVTEQDMAALENGDLDPTDEQITALVELLGLSSPDRLRGAPVPAAPDLRLVCTRRSGPLTHEDIYHVLRFAELLSSRAAHRLTP